MQNAPIAVGDDGHGHNKLEKHDAGAIESPLNVIRPIQLVAELTAKGGGVLWHVVVPENSTFCISTFNYFEL